MHLCLGSGSIRSVLQGLGLEDFPSVLNPVLCVASPLGCDLPGTFCLIRGCPLFRARLGLNESAWGRLWLEVPDSAAPDSVVTVTVTAVGQGASQVPPTHAFLRLLVLAPASQVSTPPSQPGLSRWVGRSSSPSPSLLSTGPTGGPSPRCCPCAAPSHPCLASFHFGDSGQSWGRDGGPSLVGNHWRGAVPARLHVLVTGAGRTSGPTFSLPYGRDGRMASGPCPAHLVWGSFFYHSCPFSL